MSVCVCVTFIYFNYYLSFYLLSVFSHLATDYVIASCVFIYYYAYSWASKIGMFDGVEWILFTLNGLFIHCFDFFFFKHRFLRCMNRDYSKHVPLLLLWEVENIDINYRDRNWFLVPVNRREIKKKFILIERNVLFQLSKLFLTMCFDRSEYARN